MVYLLALPGFSFDHGDDNDNHDAHVSFVSGLPSSTTRTARIPQDYAPISPSFRVWPTLSTVPRTLEDGVLQTAVGVSHLARQIVSVPRSRKAGCKPYCASKFSLLAC